jgi:preprotein translocase subunit SecE
MKYLEYLRFVNDSWPQSIAVWALVLILLFLVFRKRSVIKKFTGEVIGELRKATWPWDPKEKSIGAKYKELIDSTVVVIIAMILLAAAVSLIDFALLGLTRAIF